MHILQKYFLHQEEPKAAIRPSLASIRDLVAGISLLRLLNIMLRLHTVEYLDNRGEASS